MKNYGLIDLGTIKNEETSVWSLSKHVISKIWVSKNSSSKVLSQPYPILVFAWILSNFAPAELHKLLLAVCTCATCWFIKNIISHAEKLTV